MTAAAEQRVAAQFTSRFLRSYSRGKLRADPVYRLTQDRLRDVSTPLFDLGCGVGLLEFYLREEGWEPPITGIDHDPRKIDTARRVAPRYRGLDFRVGDVRQPLPAGVSIAALDVLHYFTPAEQRAILDNIAGAIAPGGVAVIRDAVRDGSWRFRLTVLQERFSRAVRWLRAERLQFPAREDIEAPFRMRGFTVEVVPAWGKTPFNNYLFVFRRSSGGSTNR